MVMGGPWSPQVSGNIKIQKQGRRLERSDLYCKIIQKSHGSSFFNTLQSTPWGQGPSLQFIA